MPDVLVWLHNKNGMYLVKLGYHTARILLKETSRVGERSVLISSSKAWARIWKLHIPNKIRVFGWRACHNILPTYEKLQQGRVIEDDTCTICQRFPETVIHALWECGATQAVWAGCPTEVCRRV